jgi:glycerol dehydrogenase-like iron-containing ADH family enzyme
MDDNIMQSFLWNKNTNKMIKAVEVMIVMCKKYDLPFNYKDLGIIREDSKDNDEDSMWDFTGRG